MYNKTKKILALSLFLVLGLNFAVSFAASGDSMNSTGSTSTTSSTNKSWFAMKEVQVVDANTLKVIFSKDLIENSAEMSDFVLTSKKDETKELALTWMTLSASSELTVKTVEPLSTSQEYNLVVVFASDKEGNVIENGVDGMITFSTPEKFDGTDLTLMDATASNTGALTQSGAEEVLNAASETMTGETASGETASWMTATDASKDANALPQTGPKEIFVVLIALALGFAFVYTRRKA